jgi:uncharacterized integral membrane protein
MTTPDQPPYDPNATRQQSPGAPLGAGVPPGAGAAPVPVRTVRKGPGWVAYLVTVLALLLLAAVIVFVLQNDKSLQVKFFSWKHTFNKSSVALGAAAIAGFLAGLFLGLVPWLSARRQLRSIRRSQRI